MGESRATIPFVPAGKISSLGQMPENAALAGMISSPLGLQCLVKLLQSFVRSGSADYIRDSLRVRLPYSMPPAPSPARGGMEEATGGADRGGEGGVSRATHGAPRAVPPQPLTPSSAMGAVSSNVHVGTKPVDRHSMQGTRILDGAVDSHGGKEQAQLRTHVGELLSEPRDLSRQTLLRP